MEKKSIFSVANNDESVEISDKFNLIHCQHYKVRGVKYELTFSLFAKIALKVTVIISFHKATL